MAHKVTIDDATPPPELKVEDVPAGRLFTRQDNAQCAEYVCIMHASKKSYTYLSDGATFDGTTHGDNRVGRILPETTKIHLVTK